MPNVENNIMSTFTIGGKTYEIEDSSARSNIQQITSDMSNYYTKSETYSKSEVDSLISNIDDSSQSGGGGSLIVGATIDGEGHPTLTNTWQEIYDAASVGKTVILNANPYLLNIEYLQVVGIDNSGYFVNFYDTMLYATSPNGYPTTLNDDNVSY